MKIAVVFTGGTISCSAKNDGYLAVDEGVKFALCEEILKTQNDISFEYFTPYFILSETLNAENLKTLFCCVTDILNSKLFDGVIIAHGTDTIQFTATYLALTITPSIPVVLVSSNYPLDDPRQNGGVNFLCANEFVKLGHNGVFVVNKNENSDVLVHFGDRLTEHPAQTNLLLDAKKPFGIFKNGKFVVLSENREFGILKNKALKIDDCSGIMVVTPSVGMIYPLIDDRIKAVLLKTFHSGTINTNDAQLKEFCNSAKKVGVKVYATGCVTGTNYETVQQFEELNITALYDNTPIRDYIFLWLNGCEK